MAGCQGPFCHGSGGWCGCNCNCCPPPCCPAIAVFFDCGTPKSIFPDGCEGTDVMDMWHNLTLPAIPKMPRFNKFPIAKGMFAFSALTGNCSVPCETMCVTIQPVAPTPICCMELLVNNVGDQTILAVGSGHVTAPSVIIDEREGQNCRAIKIKINGSIPPVWVNDCDPIVITLEPDECCECTIVNAYCGFCPLSFTPAFGFVNPIKKRLFGKRNGVVVINKQELLRRIAIKRRKA